MQKVPIMASIEFRAPWSHSWYATLWWVANDNNMKRYAEKKGQDIRWLNDQLNHSFSPPFFEAFLDHFFARTFVHHSFALLPVQLLILSFNSIVRLKRLLIRSCNHLFIRSFVHSFIRSIVHPIIRSFVHSFMQSFVHSFVHSFIES